MKHLIYTSILFFCLISIFTSCKESERSKISGTIAGAEGKILYLEEKKLNSTEVIDSTEIHTDGSFVFKTVLPDIPEFYRLRLGKQFITLAIDTISDINVHSDLQNFATGYSVSGKGARSSQNVKEIFLAQLDANVSISKNLAEYQKGLIADSTFMKNEDKAVNEYKTLALKYIYNNPGSMAAYFALFQEVGGKLIFNIYRKDDSKAFAAVATSYEVKHPELERSKHLHNIALYSLAAIRQQREQEKRINDINSSKEVKTVGFIDIALPNAQGDTIRLSSVTQDKVCLLSFTSMSYEWSADYNVGINDLYKAYKDKGFTVYQVGLERDAHHWLTVSKSYPWVNVQDVNAQFSQYVGLYNLDVIPTLFIINKAGDIVYRTSNLKDVAQWLKKNI